MTCQRGYVGSKGRSAGGAHLPEKEMLSTAGSRLGAPTSGQFRTKVCERCGKRRNRCLDFERFDALCRTCRPERDRELALEQNLTQTDRRVLRLRNVEGLSTKEIAAREHFGSERAISRRLKSLTDRGVQVFPPRDRRKVGV